VDISQITEYLFVGSAPKAEQADELRARNIRLIISMIGPIQPLKTFAEPPFQLLWLRAYDTPITPIPVPRLMKGVHSALAVIRNEGRVLVHCIQGRHRSVIMGAAILIAMGHSTESAVHLLTARRAAADPEARHVKWQIKRFEGYWQNQDRSLDGHLHRIYHVYHEAVGAAISQVAGGFYALQGKLAQGPEG
jgi:hypothetical protein